MSASTVKRFSLFIPEDLAKRFKALAAYQGSIHRNWLKLFLLKQSPTVAFLLSQVPMNRSQVKTPLALTKRSGQNPLFKN
jgi:hypothetical protein